MTERIIFSKDKMVKKGFDDRTLDRLMHSDDAWKVGYYTDGGQFRFVLPWLLDYLKADAKSRI